ncbi:unnamed protein product, partial [Urochloa humidicola]
ARQSRLWILPVIAPILLLSSRVVAASIFHLLDPISPLAKKRAARAPGGRGMGGVGVGPARGRRRGCGGGRRQASSCELG